MGLKHAVKTVKLNRTPAHREALFRTQVRQLVEHQRIRTTIAKAKALKPHAERLVTLAKRDTDFSRKKARSILESPSLYRRLVGELKPRFESRPGGYTRIVKLNENRFGDNSRMAYIEYVDNDLDPIIPPRESRRISPKRSKLEENFWNDFMGVDPDGDERREVSRNLEVLRAKFAQIEPEFQAARALKTQRENELARID